MGALKSEEFEKGVLLSAPGLSGVRAGKRPCRLAVLPQNSLQSYLDGSD